MGFLDFAKKTGAELAGRVVEEHVPAAAQDLLRTAINPPTQASPIPETPKPAPAPAPGPQDTFPEPPSKLTDYLKNKWLLAAVAVVLVLILKAKKKRK